MSLYSAYKGTVKSLHAHLSVIGTRIFHSDILNINSIRQGLCHRIAWRRSVRHSVSIHRFHPSLTHRQTAVRFWTQSLRIHTRVPPRSPSFVAKEWIVQTAFVSGIFVTRNLPVAKLPSRFPTPIYARFSSRLPFSPSYCYLPSYAYGCTCILAREFINESRVSTNIPSLRFLRSTNFLRCDRYSMYLV